MPLLLLTMFAATVSGYKMVYHSTAIAPALGLHCAIPQAAQRVSLNETAVSAEAGSRYIDILHRSTTHTRCR